MAQKVDLDLDSSEAEDDGQTANIQVDNPYLRNSKGSSVFEASPEQQPSFSQQQQHLNDMINIKDEDDRLQASVVILETNSCEEEEEQDEDYARVYDEALERQDRMLRTISDEGL